MSTTARALLGCWGLVSLLACPLPRPQRVDVVLEVGETEVVIDGRFTDLRVPDDPLLAFQAMGLQRSASEALKPEPLPRWVEAVDRWELSEVDGRVDLRVVARATRETFERCSAVPCGQPTPAACAGWVLRRACLTEDYDALARSTDDPYLATEDSARTWPADTSRVELRLRRGSPRAERFPRSAASVWPLLRAPEPATQALAWMGRLDDAVAQGRPAQVMAAARTPPDLPEPLSALLTERLRRERLRVWYGFLSSFDPRWLVPPPEGAWRSPWLERGLPIPHSPPAEWAWRARAAYEVWQREPSAYGALSRELCGEPLVRRRRDLRAFCEVVGALDP